MSVIDLGESPIAAVAPNTSQASLLVRTAKGVGWIVAWRMVTRLLGLASTLTLVRLLLPADFGLVALGSGFALAVDALSILGVEDALIRHPSPSPAMYHTAFTMNAVRGVMTALVIAIAAIPVGVFFKEPRLANVLFALALGSLVQGVNSVGVVDFRRDMVFQKEFALQVLPRLVSIVVTIVTAFAWRSYWALVAGTLTGRAVRMLFSFRMHPYRAQLTLSAWRDLIGFSLWTWATAMVELVLVRTDGFIIGRIMSPTSVGIYSVGQEIAVLPTTEFIEPLCRVCFSSFALTRTGGGGSVPETYLRVVASAFLITLPAGIGISLVADPLVRLAVGIKWLAAIPVIQVIGLVSVATVFGYISSVLFSAYGLLKRNFTICAAGVVLRLAIGIPLTSRYGLPGAAVGVGIAILVDQLGFVIWSFHRFGIHVGPFFRQIWRPCAATATMAAVLAALHLGWAAASGDARHLALQLFATVALGAATYGATICLCWFASGRPEGAERDLLTAADRFIRHLRARVAG